MAASMQGARLLNQRRDVTWQCRAPPVVSSNVSRVDMFCVSGVSRENHSSSWPPSRSSSDVQTQDVEKVTVSFSIYVRKVLSPQGSQNCQERQAQLVSAAKHLDAVSCKQVDRVTCALHCNHRNSDVGDIVLAEILQADRAVKGQQAKSSDMPTCAASAGHSIADMCQPGWM